jgi:predicted tellurium resistance membrane protein TerC
MGAAAAMIARALQKHRWIAYVGLALILYVALVMMWDGGHEIREAVTAAFPDGFDPGTFARGIGLIG